MIFRKKPYLLVFMMSCLTACAGKLPVPGGSDTINQSFYTTKDNLLEVISTLHTGMTEKEAFAAMGHNKDELIQLGRDQIITALYGSSTVEFKDGLPDHQDSRAFLQSLDGYRLNYKIVEREHGFSSPIRIRTDESGFDYAVTLVFREGTLYAAPILSGGVVNRSSSKTIFDYFNPGSIYDRAIKY